VRGKVVCFEATASSGIRCGGVLQKLPNSARIYLTVEVATEYDSYRICWHAIAGSSRNFNSAPFDRYSNVVTPNRLPISSFWTAIYQCRQWQFRWGNLQHGQ
jgi:hypothetical protein